MTRLLRKALAGISAAVGRQRRAGVSTVAISPDEDPLAFFESETPRAAVRVAAISPDEDSLAFFDSETRRGARHEPPKGLQISLDRVLERCTPLFWVEAVAIVEGVCTFLKEGGNGNRVPDQLCKIAITPSGGVLVDINDSEGPPGPRLARILLTLTASAAVPVALRLFITRWASFAEPHGVVDYEQSLAHFARPNGSDLIQAVYQRCMAAEPGTGPIREAVPDALSANPTRPHSKRVRHTWLIVGAASVSACSAAVVWLWSGWTVAQPPEPGTAPDQSTEAVSVAAPRSQRDTGRAPEPGPSPRRGATSATDVRTAPATTRSATSVRSLPNVPPVAAPPAPAPVAEVVMPPLAIAAAGPIAIPRIATSSDSAALGTTSIPSLSRSTSDPARIYSGADPDVTPPAIIDASLPPPLLSEIREVNTMELLISERGLVERVRLISKPRRMADMMLLSGAKTWKFEPALKDGLSVRYRLLLSWAATP